MKILHVSDCYLPRLGGIELHIRDLARHQRLEGDEVVVATRTASVPPNSASEDVLRVRSLSSQDLAAIAPDVVHAHLSVVSPMTIAAVGRAASLGIPAVVTVHSLWSDLAPMGPLVRTAAGLDRWPVVWTAVSEPAAREVRRVTRRPVTVIPNAVDPDFWSPASLGRLPRTGEDVGPTVLSVMRLTTVKRTVPLARILRVVADRTEMNAIIVGDGPKRPALETYLHRHGLTRRVRVTGALDRSAVREAMAQASVFVAPARRESFGIAALEARAAGLPVVAHARSGVASFIEPGLEGLLGDDDEQLAHHIVDLLRDEALRERIARHNRTVPPVHTWSAAVVNNHRAYSLAGAGAPLRTGYGDGLDLDLAVGQ